MAKRRIEHAEEEEVDEAGNVCLAALVFDDLHDLVVCRGVELDEDFAHHAHARLATKINAGERVEVMDDLVYDALDVLPLELAYILFEIIHPLAKERLCTARLLLVRTHAIQTHHEQIAQDERRHGGLEHRGRNLETGVALAGVVEGQRDDRYVVKPCLVQALADERDVVGRATAATGLRDDESGLVHIVLATGGRFHDLAGDEDGRIADVVVHVLEARVHGRWVHARQQLHVVAVMMEDGYEQLEVDGRHLRGENRIARVLHLLRVLGARKLGRSSVTVGCEVKCTQVATVRHGWFNILGNSVCPVRTQRLDGSRRDVDSRRALARLRGHLAQLLLLTQRCHERANADARGT